MALSTRAQSWALLSDDLLIWKVVKDLYHSTNNPTGFVSLGIAENSLMHDEMTEYINKNAKIVPHGLTYGDGGTGSRHCQAAMAHFLNRKLQPVVPIKPPQICMTNGVTSAIEHISVAIADPGDIFLLAQPYYGAFVSDIQLRTGIEVCRVAFGELDHFSLEGITAYVSAIKTCHAQGKRVAGLMLCNPHNPLGRCYSREYIIELMKLCEKHKIHLVSDEIYANSVFSDDGTQFTSLASIPTDGLIDPNLTHILYGLSKDFGANGIRIGAIISQHNTQVHQALIPLSIYTYASSLVESLATVMLQDDEWVDWYIAENHRRLKKNYEITARWAGSRGVEYIKGVTAAFFLWVNLGPHYLQKNGREETGMAIEDKSGESNHTSATPEAPQTTATEDASTGFELDSKIENALVEQKVFLASGSAFGSEKPGWFRIVFSQDETRLKMGLERIERALGLGRVTKI